LVLTFLLLFVRQKLLLFRVFLKQLLRLLLMLLLNELLFGRIRLLLREFGVVLLLLLLNFLPVLLLLRAKLILLLLVFLIQVGVRGGWNDEPGWSRSLVRMNCRSRTRAIGLIGWNTLLLGSILPGFFRNSLELHRLLPCLVVSGLLCSFLLDLFRGGLLLHRLLLSGLLLGPFRCRLLIL
jgi:hypothetical protein